MECDKDKKSITEISDKKLEEMILKETIKVIEYDRDCKLRALSIKELVERDEANNNLKKMIRSMSEKTENTDEMLEKILKEASNKYPIKRYSNKEIEDKENETEI